MTPSKPARGETRHGRTPLLIGAAVAMLCVGAGAASAQTVADEPTADATTAEGDTTTTTEDAGTQDTGAADPGATDDAAATTAEQDSGDATEKRRAPRLLLENVDPHQIYFAGKRPATFHYKFTGTGATDLKIQVVKKGPGKVINGWSKNNVPADQKQQVRWDGSKKGGGHIRKGRFFFRVQTADGQALRRKRASGKREFWVRPAIFPVRGRHQYWDGFGAGRNHQGQDIGANCGTTLVAAEAGRVAYKAYNGGGYGYYLVINVRNQARAEVYGHLKRPATVREGARVKTGQKIGLVGATGNASGCHLHFEYWKGDWPGGNAIARVTKRLRTWDGWS